MCLSLQHLALKGTPVVQHIENTIQQDYTVEMKVVLIRMITTVHMLTQRGIHLDT